MNPIDVGIQTGLNFTNYGRISFFDDIALLEHCLPLVYLFTEDRLVECYGN